MTTALPPDPWKALGLERSADKSDVRTAYKKLVLKCHPDKVQDPTLKALKANEFQKVQQAYELLNDDAEKAKYEQKLRLAEQRAKAYPEVKSSPNMSVPRSTTKYEIRTTVEQTSRHKSSPSSGGKVYYTPHTRSHEEMPRTYALYDETDRQARRTASYEKPSKRDDERRDRDREERRRRRDEDELRLRDSRDRERDRERQISDKEREGKKADKKRLEKERERERKRDSEDKARRHKPYVEPYDTYVEEALYEADEKYVTGRPEKKRSSSRKHDEPRERERERERDKSASRRAKSPHLGTDKHVDLFAHAASYINTASHIGASPPSTKAFWASQSHPEPAPTPPPVDLEDESIRYAAARAAGRRSSNDPTRSREKLKYDAPDATPKGRPIPSLSKSYSTPPAVPESPPRISRSQTTPQESYRTIPIPSLNRTQTWAAGTTQYLDELVDWEDDARDDRPRRSSRRARSPTAQATHRYKVDGIKTSKLEPQYAYGGESPTSTRARYADDGGRAARSPSHVHGGLGIPVKVTKSYDWNDVSFSSYGGPAYYSKHEAEAYA